MILTDDEFIKIGGILLPGIFKSIDIKGSAIVDELEIEGKGKKPKQAIGYEDHKIDIELILMDDLNPNGMTCYDKLTIIQSIFRKKGQRVPTIYDIVNQHTAKRGIDKVIFKDMTTKQTNKKQEITVSLSFLEYESINIKITKNNKKEANNNINANLNQDYKNYLNDRGQAPRIKDKTEASPAIIN